MRLILKKKKICLVLKSWKQLVDVDADFPAILATLTDCEENIEEKCGLPLTRKDIMFLETTEFNIFFFKSGTGQTS